MEGVDVLVALFSPERRPKVIKVKNIVFYYSSYCYYTLPSIFINILCNIPHTTLEAIFGLVFGIILKVLFLKYININRNGFLFTLLYYLHVHELFLNLPCGHCIGERMRRGVGVARGIYCVTQTSPAGVLLTFYIFQ